MRAVIQRVLEGSVTVNGEQVRRMGKGLLVLLGVGQGDGEKDAAWMAEKVAGLRLFSDAEGKMNLALADVGGAVLVVSQFTLYGNAEKGRRPSFIDAARPEEAITLYNDFVAQLRTAGLKVETGEFGTTMDVALVNDGPVTLVLERPPVSPQ